MTAPTEPATAGERTVGRIAGPPPAAGWPVPLPPRQRPAAALSVLDVTKYFGATTGGVRTYLLEKARYVAGHPELRQVLVVPGAESSVVDGDGVRCYRVAGPPIPFQHPYRFLLSGAALGRVIAHEAPDIIEVGSPFAVPWVTRRANRAPRRPTVWFYHGHLPRVIAPDAATAGLARRAGAAAMWRYVERVGRLFDAVFAGSEFAARDLEAHGVGPVIRVPLGVDLDTFHPARRARRDDVRRREGWPEGPVAIHVGRLAREKQLEVVLAAWEEVERRTGATLVLVGAGPSEAHYRRLAGGRRVRWRAFEPDRAALADLVAAADLYVAPCPVETFGLAGLEAMAVGTPVLSAGQGGLAEKVSASGGGRLYPPGDVAACADAAVALLEADGAAIGRAGRAYAERHHAWPAAFEAIFAEYRRVLGR